MRVNEELRGLMSLASRGDANVLITGPTGSGKSFLARRIHESGSRRTKPFVTVNLATLHEGTFESELFGHERGAFTGADQRRVGRLERANGGTVFLDEVGELTPRFQARLLEFLQSRIISPLGTNREIRLDVRVIAATNKNLLQGVARGEFREDLFHRLRVVTVGLKPLNERWDEFDELVHSTLAELCATNQRKILKISEDVAELLEKHDWPGNLRELRNVLEYAVLSAGDGSEIRGSDLPPWFAEASLNSSPAEACHQIDFDLGRYFAGLDYSSALELFEKQYLERALQRYRGRINHTARKIGINKTTLIRRMRAYGLNAQECSEALLNKA